MIGNQVNLRSLLIRRRLAQNNAMHSDGNSATLVCHDERRKSFLLY